MPKFDWGFDLADDVQAQKDNLELTILCTRTDTFSRYALRNNPDYEWGECIETTMSLVRNEQAEHALLTWGWL